MMDKVELKVMGITYNPVQRRGVCAAAARGGRPVPYPHRGGRG